MSVRVRLMNDSDVPWLVSMGLRFLGELYDGFGTPVPDRLAWVLDVARESGAVWVAVTDAGERVGMLVAVLGETEFTGERVSEEKAWWVNPDARGAAGAKLWHRWIRWARDNQCACVLSRSPAHSQAQLWQFYHRLGFRPVETLHMLRLLSAPERTIPTSGEDG